MARNKRVPTTEPMYKYTGHNHFNGRPLEAGELIPDDALETLRERMSRVITQFISQPGNEKDRAFILDMGIPVDGKGA